MRALHEYERVVAMLGAGILDEASACLASLFEVPVCSYRYAHRGRCVNRFETKLPSGRTAEYAYVRYFFSNLSEDIKDVFCEHCDLLGIRWSRANARYVSVHDRKSVALIDEFVGPKA